MTKRRSPLFNYWFFNFWFDIIPWLVSLLG